MTTAAKLLGKYTFVLIIVLVLCSLNNAIAQAPKLKLKDAIYLALQVHPNGKIATNNVEVANQKVKESKGAFLPTVSVNANSDYNLKLPTTVIPAGGFSDKEIKMKMGSPVSSNVSAQAEIMLLDQAAIHNLNYNKVEKEVAVLKADKENETIIYNTATAYFETITFLEKKKLLLENEKQNEQLLQILKLRHEQGVAKKSEYDRARVNLNSVKAEINLNQSQYVLALNRLKNAIGVDLEEEINIDESISFTPPSKLPVMSELEADRLIDFRIDQKNLKLKEIDLKKKYGAFLPTLSATGRYGANAFGAEFSNAYSNWIDYSAIGLKLNIPIFSGLKRSSQLSQSRFSLENQRLTTKVNSNNYRLEYQNSGTQLISSYNNLISNKENLQLSEEVLNATTVEYKEGSADLTTYLDTESSYKEAQMKYTTSLLDFLNAQLAYEKANGTLTTYINNLEN